MAKDARSPRARRPRSAATTVMSRCAGGISPRRSPRRVDRMHGWIILDKPLGLGSTQGVSAVKRALRDAGYGPKLRDLPKVGHGGTLDPLATGVLPIAVGEAT